jgi:hypothetical protein
MTFKIAARFAIMRVEAQPSPGARKEIKLIRNKVIFSRNI